MKKFFSIFLAACGLMAFVACDDDIENPYAHQSAIEVTSCDLDFSPEASTGSIHFTAPGAVTVTTSSPWCSASVVADSIVVSVEGNPSISGRSSVVVMRCGVDSMQFAVTQRGVAVYFDRKSARTSNDEAHTMSFGVHANVDVNVIEAPEWAQATIADGNIVIDFSANDTSMPRAGYIKYQAGAYTDSIAVSQADFERDIAGSYTLYYRSTADATTERPLNVTLREGEIYLNAYRMSIPFTYDADNLALSIQSGQHIGSYSGSQIYLLFAGYEYYTAYETDVFCNGAISLDGDQLRIDFSANISTDVMIRFMFERFSQANLSEAYDQGLLLSLFYPYMVKR